MLLKRPQGCILVVFIGCQRAGCPPELKTAELRIPLQQMSRTSSVRASRLALLECGKKPLAKAELSPVNSHRSVP
ncbi:hypothetical protein IE4872_CH01953 [Rhizobium gallicum]|uniref:Lipoprotein n=1 Tax=Rhizobium gallicum TaxID=56730 RepID=A0A1L5NI72_9HYPH|nr:hypothetical protein IE4872_CH01953 [Rhizobium gallicum]